MTEIAALFYFLTGLSFLLFRIWIVNFKLREELGKKQYHISRILIHYFCIALITGFSSNLFTLICVVSMPTMITAFIWFDVPYFRTFNADKSSSAIKNWILVERLTLHLPIIIFSVLFYTFNKRSFFYTLFTIPNIIIAILICFGPFILIDPRIALKDEYPIGKKLLTAAIFETIGIFGFLYLLVVGWWPSSFYNLIGNTP
jgi:hypothetical protein